MTITERQSGGRILCIRLSGLGDIVHALNALSLLRRQRPDAHITWLVEDRFSAVIHGHPYIDELIPVPRKFGARLFRQPRRWGELWGESKHMWKRLRAGRYDISVDFQSSLKSAWLVWAAAAGLRVAFDRGVNRELNWLVQNRRVRVPAHGVHRIERDLALLAPLGIPTQYAAPLLPVAREALQDVAAALDGQLSGGPLVVIHPGTSGFAAFKRWAPERYARVADRLVAERGADVVVTYGPQDLQVAEDVVSAMGRRGILSAPTRNLQQLSAILSRAELFIGADTGPMHMASALGVPVVALFGPKDPEQTGPYCSRSIVVTAPVRCRPCTKRRCPHVRCMTGITPARVARAALDVLDGGGECVGRPGPIRKPTTLGFQLGRWRGRITTCNSRPALYARLCDPAALLDSPEARPIHNSASRRSAFVPGTDGGPRLVAKSYSPRRSLYRKLGDLLLKPRARNSWDSGLRLLQEGVPTPFPVCHMESGAGVGREQLVLTEEFEEAVSLKDWLTANWPGTSPQDRRTLIEGVAAFVQSLHRAGFWHADLRPANILCRPGPDGMPTGFHIIDVDRTKYVGWLPPLLKDSFFGADLRNFTYSLKVPVTVAEAVRFFRTYCRGFIDAPHRRRIVRNAVLKFPGNRDEWRRGGFPPARIGKETRS